MDTIVTVRVEKDVKDKAANILREKGLTVSLAMQQVFDHIVRTGDMPIAGPDDRPSKEEIARRLELFNRFQLDEPLQMTDDEVREARLREKYGSLD